MALYRERAIVLRSYKLSEADKIVVLYSRGRGLIRAVAKGVRRTKSKFGSKLESGSVVDLQLYEGRNLDIATQAERVESFSNTRAKLDLLCRASVMLEIVETSGSEGENNPAMFKLLNGALRELDTTENQRVLPAFVAKYLVLEGVQPLVDSCVRCSSTTELNTIQLSEGGALCRACPGGERISQTSLEALSLLFSGRVRQVLDVVDHKTTLELETVSTKLVEQHVERKLKSAAILYEQIDA